MKNIPNIISIFRIALCLFLPFLLNNKVFLIILYLIIGISDVLDGLIARKFNWQTKLGARLDSLADFVFAIVVLGILICKTNFMKTWNILFLIALVLIIRISNLIITKIKFNIWSILHTYTNKIDGLALFLLLPLYIMKPRMIIIFLTGLITLFSALEETIILLKLKKYDLNIKSIIKL